MAVPFLEVDDISKSFGGLKAVANVSFSMGRDEIVGLIGPNGAGKTTLLRLITGILKADSGSVRFKGQKIVGMKTWDIVNQGIACTFQNMRPFRRLPIIANVMVSCLAPRAMKRPMCGREASGRNSSPRLAGVPMRTRWNASRMPALSAGTNSTISSQGPQTNPLTCWTSCVLPAFPIWRWKKPPPFPRGT